eukprot:3862973-Amphidinium_carterae.2
MAALLFHDSAGGSNCKHLCRFHLIVKQVYIASPKSRTPPWKASRLHLCPVRPTQGIRRQAPQKH